MTAAKTLSQPAKKTLALSHRPHLVFRLFVLTCKQFFAPWQLPLSLVAWLKGTPDSITVASAKPTVTEATQAETQTLNLKTTATEDQETKPKTMFTSDNYKNCWSYYLDSPTPSQPDWVFLKISNGNTVFYFSNSCIEQFYEHPKSSHISQLTSCDPSHKYLHKGNFLTTDYTFEPSKKQFNLDKSYPH